MLASRQTIAVSCVLRVAALLLSAGAAHAADLVFADDFDPEAGAGPTQTCTVNPDAEGFFTRTGPTLSVVVRLPAGYDSANPTPQRLLALMHGCGDSAYNFAKWAVVPSALRASQDYIGVSLGGREGDCFNTSSDAQLVAAAIADIRSCFYVHRKQVVIGGYSSGGDLAYKLAVTNSRAYAGVLIENAALSNAVGAANVNAVLDAVGWNLNVAHSARTNDTSYPIAGVRNDRDKLLAHGFPLVYRELSGTHDGNSEDWAYLIPLMGDWSSP